MIVNGNPKSTTQIFKPKANTSYYAWVKDVANRTNKTLFTVTDLDFDPPEFNYELFDQNDDPDDIYIEYTITDNSPFKICVMKEGTSGYTCTSHSSKVTAKVYNTDFSIRYDNTFHFMRIYAEDERGNTSRTLIIRPYCNDQYHCNIGLPDELSVYWS